MSGPELIEEILKQTKVSPCHMRLVTRGKLVTADNIWKLLFEVKDESRRKKLKFMIFGEKQEVISDAIYPGDIDTIVSQCGVGRNEAIRALNQTDGYLIDAMLLVTS